MAQEAENRAFIQILENQVKSKIVVAGQVIEASTSKSAMDTAEGAGQAPATDRQGAGSEVRDLRERLRVAEDDLGVTTARMEALHKIIAEMQGRDKERRAALDQAQEQVVRLQAQLQTARADHAALLVGYYAARVAAGLPTTPKESTKEEDK